MATFKYNGIDELSASFEQLAQLDDDSKWTILQAGAEVFKRVQQKWLNAYHHLTGQLEASISIERKMDGGEIVAHVVPKGKHKGSGTGKRMKKTADGKRRSSGHYSGSAAEVAYFLEYGTPRMPATHWMEMANEEAENDVGDAMEAAWDEYLKSLGL